MKHDRDGALITNRNPFSCDRCLWGQEREVMPGEVVARRFCRRFPPQMIVGPQGVSSGFPFVGDKSYCGEFSPLQTDA